MQQIGGYLGYAGRGAGVVAKAAFEPQRTRRASRSSASPSRAWTSLQALGGCMRPAKSARERDKSFVGPLLRSTQPTPGRRSGTLSRCPIIREPACTAQAVRKACFPLFRLSLSPLASAPFDGRLPWVGGRLPWVARRRTSIGCLRDQALSWSRMAILQGGSGAQPKLKESRKDHARSQRAAFLFPTMLVAVSPRPTLCPNARSAATRPRRLGSRR